MRQRFLPASVPTDGRTTARSGRRWSFAIVVAVALALASGGAESGRRPGPAAAGPALPLEVLPAARFQVGGVLGERLRGNTRNWLLRAPGANPGLLGMFRDRDRKPPPQVVDWAGEFAGKYLLSAVLALPLEADPTVERHVRQFVERLLACQAEDGYLGPFPRDERLLGHWDLWGHYHILLGLLAWSEQAGDERALQAARRIGDLVCRKYLDGPRRVIDAGSPEMNMAIVHGLARLYRRTGERRYLRMAQEVVADFEKAGDYLRTGLAGIEFHRTPRPRWESLHALQGLAELYLATGTERYRTAFLRHWASIRRLDVHSAGSFSAGEQATGDPYPLRLPIETCCTVAWQAITLDALRLTGDATIADELERTTFNAVAAAQHPSGSWWTYSTPLNGVRKASHHDIVFQARPGTPDLNCCSVNGPRGLASLGQWAVMRGGDGGLAVHFYGPGRAGVPLPGGEVVLRQETDYPVGGRVRLTLGLARPMKLSLRLRIPAWSRRTRVTLNGAALAGTPIPGQYCAIERSWKDGDRVELDLDMRLRCEAGDGEAAGRVAVFRGPLLLAYDQAFNDFDEEAIPRLDATALENTEARPEGHGAVPRGHEHPPWLLVSVPGAGGRSVRLCDFASAGSAGTRYRSWLAADRLRPPPPAPLTPADGAVVAPGAIRFRWRPPSPLAPRQHAVILSPSPDGNPVALRFGQAAGSHLVLPAREAARLEAGKVVYWWLVATNDHGETRSVGPARQLRIDPKLPAAVWPDTPFGERASDRVLIEADLKGDVQPSYGQAGAAAGWRADGSGARRAVAFDGKSGIARYQVEEFPPTDYAVSLRVWLDEVPARLSQVFSAWAGPLDDPLRLCLDGGKLFARVEAGKVHGTGGVALERGRWYHLAAVKAGRRLTLYVDGEARGSCELPERIYSRSQIVSVAGNPRYTETPEFLAARFRSLRLYAAALSAEQVRGLAREQP